MKKRNNINSLLSKIALWVIKKAVEYKEGEILKCHSRFLSFGDYIFDRWERAQKLGFGEGSSVYDNVLVIGDVKVGKNCWIGPNTILDGSGGLVIGDNCAISSGVHIYSHSSVGRIVVNEATEKKEVVIGSNTYIGPNSIIAMGTIIGNNCAVGALSFVNGLHIPNNSKCYGIPAKLIT